MITQPESFVRGGGSNFDNVFFLVDDGRKDPNTTISGPSLAPPAKHHLNGVSLIDNPALVTYIRSLPNMECWLGSFVILRGTGLICLETLFMVIFQGGGVRTPPPLWNSPMWCLPFMALHENSPLSLIGIAIWNCSATPSQKRDLLFLHVHPTQLALW